MSDITMGHEWLAGRFEENRERLRASAYQMLGSLSEADDAVQEAWLRLSRSDAAAIQNLRGWLTTVVAHVCLDMLRSRASRREDSIETQLPEPVANRADQTDPEREALLADSVGVALLVVLNRLTPAERIAFVLHDMFDVSFNDVAGIVGRSPSAARQLASRARRRVRGPIEPPGADLASQRKVVEAFLAALRSGDVDALLAVLDPDVFVHIEERDGTREIHGAANWARGAMAFSRHARSVQLALVEGTVGIIMAPRGRLFSVLRFTIADGKIRRADIVTDPARLKELDLAVLSD